MRNISAMENSVANDARTAALQEFGNAYRDVARAQRRLRGRDAMRSGEISAPQMNLLLPLAEEGSMSSGQLAEAAGLTPATTTHMLDQLAAAGIVERERSESDRRVVVSQLTEQGRELLERRRNQMLIAWNESLKDLSADDLKIATEALQRVTEFVDEL
jgi:DNA-binding MarR family transcriptional regulator